MASQRPTGDLLEIIEKHSKEIRKLKRRQKGLITPTERKQFTPTLTATSTDPDLGTGSNSSGAYIKIGEQVIYRFFIQFGSGSSPGSGRYNISVPEPISSSIWATGTYAIGSAILFDWSVAGHKELAVPYASGSDSISLVVKDATVFHNNPFNWDDDDRFSATVMYDTG